ncbi:MAG: Nif11 family protein [Rhodocyclaceae bacterium]|nr:Nif11 family protein [Rhodocyclaceae bacterium]
MSTDGFARFERFRAHVAADGALQERLRHIADEEAFIVAVLEMAAGEGFRLEREDVLAALNAGRRAWLERWL